MRSGKLNSTSTRFRSLMLEKKPVAFDKIYRCFEQRSVSVLEGYCRPVGRITLPISVPPVQYELTLPEAKLLLRSATDIHTRCFIAIALLTGARRSAICELTWSRVDFQEHTLDFSPHNINSGRRKGRSCVPITEDLSDYLSACRVLNGGSPSDTVCRWGPMTLYMNVIESGRRARMPRRITPRVLSHTAAVRMIRSAPLIYASRVLGHSSVETTQNIYRQVLAENLRPAAHSLNQLLVIP